MRTRNHKKQFWLNDEEAKALKDKSAKAGINESDFIRKVLLDYKLKEKPDKEFYEYIKLLRSISNNMNQLAYKANAFGYIEEEYYKKAVINLTNFIDELKSKYVYNTKEEKNQLKV